MKKFHKRLLAGILTAAMLMGQMAVFASASPQAVPEADKDVNLARLPGVTASSNNEESSHPASAAIDGNYTGDSRWASDNDNQGTTERTLTLDLGSPQTISSVKLFWEQPNATNYFIETSNDNSQWQSQVNVKTPSTEKNVTHTLPAPVNARYIRLRVTNYTAAAAAWYNVSVYEFEVYGKAQQKIGNLARLGGVEATASNSDDPNKFPPSAVIDGIYTNESRWSTDTDGAGTTPRTLELNLGAERTITNFKIFWEKENIKDYTIETSSNHTDWHECVKVANDKSVLEPSHDLAEPVKAQYVRLTVTRYGESVQGWYNVAVREFEVNGHLPADAQLPDDPVITLPEKTNLALEKTVTAEASNVENGTQFTADKARDGNKTEKKSRWATDQNASSPTITYHLNGKYKVGSVILYWENNNPDKWHVETSVDGTNWETQASFEGKLPMADSPIQTVNFPKPVEARHVRVRVENYSSKRWNNVSLYEFEVYQGESEVVVTPATVADELSKTISIKDNKVTMSGTAPEKYTAVWGCNYEQVVAEDGTIYTPIVDTTVEVTVTVRAKDDPNQCGFAKVNLLIPGAHSKNEGNAKPAVVPELAQWYSSPQQAEKVFTLTKQSRIIADESMKSVAQELKKDILDLFGLDLTIAAADAKDGDIKLTKINGEGFDQETYNLEITNQVVIQANHPTGAYWGTRSLLQAMVLSQNQTVPQGTARDYPEFKNRGFTLDVGRKPMSMAMMQEFVKNMAWYKMNDFHVHLTDNLIFMEDYVKAGKEEEAWNAYQGFRLESSKEGLTSKDYAYTKEEFKSFIQNSRNLGVSIVPELDVPAHALSLSNYIKNTLKRPDLVLNKKGSNNRPWFDHVDISKPEAIKIVEDVFDEYIDEGVFDEDTIVHIGADEFYDSHPAYRNFLIQMIEHIKLEKNRQVRAWASLSQMSGEPEKFPFTSQNVHGAQANLWSLGWANPLQTFNLGFDLINTLDSDMYIVPSGNGSVGAYGDFLPTQSLYNSWEPENVGGTWLPTGSKQLLGASFAIWQDNIDTHACGINETDTFHRFMSTMPYLSVKMWGTGGDSLDRSYEQVQKDIATLSVAPNSNPYHTVERAANTEEYASYSFESSYDNSGNNHDLTLTNADIKDGSLILKGDKSYAETGLNVIGPNNSLSMKVYKDSKSQDKEQILIEADSAYGESNIKALPSANGKWKLGFARELYEYTFNYDLPHDQWVDLTIRNENNKTYLLVNGEKIEAVGAFLPNEYSTTPFMGKTNIGHSSFDIPAARIGSKTNSFQGKIESLAFYPNDVTLSQKHIVTFKDFDKNIMDEIAVKDGEALADRFPKDPVKEGYRFDKWVDEAGKQVTKDTVITNDMTIQSTWTKLNPDKPNPDKPNPDKPNPDKPTPDKPNPDKPKPDTPNKPVTPNKPEQKPVAPTPAQGGVQTGDSTYLLLWTALLGLSISAVVFVGKKRITQHRR